MTHHDSNEHLRPTANLTSTTGDQLVRVALAVLVYTRTSSVTLTALTLALTVVPAALLAPYWPPRHAPARTRALTGTLCAALALTLTIPVLPLPILWTLAALQSTASALFRSTHPPPTPATPPAHGKQKATATNQTEEKTNPEPPTTSTPNKAEPPDNAELKAATTTPTTTGSPTPDGPEAAGVGWPGKKPGSGAPTLDEAGPSDHAGPEMCATPPTATSAPAYGGLKAVEGGRRGEKAGAEASAASALDKADTSGHVGPVVAAVPPAAAGVPVPRGQGAAEGGWSRERLSSGPLADPATSAPGGPTSSGHVGPGVNAVPLAAAGLPTHRKQEEAGIGWPGEATGSADPTPGEAGAPTREESVAKGVGWPGEESGSVDSGLGGAGPSGRVGPEAAAVPLGAADGSAHEESVAEGVGRPGPRTGLADLGLGGAGPSGRVGPEAAAAPLGAAGAPTREEPVVAKRALLRAFADLVAVVSGRAGGSAASAVAGGVGGPPGRVAGRSFLIAAGRGGAKGGWVGPGVVVGALVAGGVLVGLVGASWVLPVAAVIFGVGAVLGGWSSVARPRSAAAVLCGGLAVVGGGVLIDVGGVVLVAVGVLVCGVARSRRWAGNEPEVDAGRHRSLFGTSGTSSPRVDNQLELGAGDSPGDQGSAEEASHVALRAAQFPASGDGRRRRRRRVGQFARLPLRSRVFLVAVEVFAVGVTVVFAVRWPAGGEAWRNFAVVAGMGVLVAEMTKRVERMRRRFSDTPHVNMSSVWTFSAALVTSPALAAGVAVVLYAHLWWRSWRDLTGMHPFRVVFSGSAVVLSCQAAFLVNLWLPGPLPVSAGGPLGLLAFVAVITVYWAVNSALVGAAISLLRPARSLARLVGSWGENAIECATLVLGGFVALVLTWYPWAVALMPLPLYVLHRSVLARQFEYEATVDDKTGLLKAGTWQSLATHEVERTGQHGAGLALLMVDVDHFKHVNDRFGHLVGDQALRAIAGCLRDAVRVGDIVGRFGGEEFVVLLAGADRAGGVETGHRICEAVRALRIEDGLTGARYADLRLTVSVGVATFAADGHTLEELLRAADTALFATKDAGRDGVGAIRAAGHVVDVSTRLPTE